MCFPISTTDLTLYQLSMCKLFNKGAFLQGDMGKQESWTLSIAIDWSEKM